MSIIAISAKVGGGKDTVGKIIQFLTLPEDNLFRDDYKMYCEMIPYHHPMNTWEIKKFATKLKQIACMMLGCTMEQLEDQEFKKQPLPDQWQTEYNSLEEGAKTYRWFLQTLGTESTREMIHGNFWINGLFTDYNPQCKNDCNMRTLQNPENVCEAPEIAACLPNWIITDLRFPNELKAVKQHQGITIRINRKRDDVYYYNAEYITLDQLRETIKKDIGEYPLYEYCKNYRVAEHESEIALDKAKFDFVIDNNGTIEELIEKVREILIEINVIK